MTFWEVRGQKIEVGGWIRVLIVTSQLTIQLRNSQFTNRKRIMAAEPGYPLQVRPMRDPTHFGLSAAIPAAR